MPQENKISIAFGTDDIQRIKYAINEIAQVLKGRVQSLTPQRTPDLRSRKV